MSYGSPYGYASPDELLAPARRASTLLIVLGVLTLLLGGCLGAVGLGTEVADAEQFIRQIEAQPGAQPFPIAAEQALVAVKWMAAIVLGAGVAMVLLGAVVRGGNRAGLVVSLILGAGLALLLGAALLASVVAAAGGQPMALVGGACLYGLPFALVCLALVWLVQGLANAGKVDAARAYVQQWQQQYAWQQQQQQQAYAAQLRQQQEQEQEQQAPPTPHDPDAPRSSD